MSYNELRHIADSYGLAAMVATYLVLVLWPLRPGARRHHESAANMIFAEDGDQACESEGISHG